MFTILIVDDYIGKIQMILDALKDEINTGEIIVDYEMEVKKACESLEKKVYDMLVLDVQLPSLGSREKVSKRGGIDLLHMIESMNRLNKPLFIVGLTAYDEGYGEVEEEFRKALWVLLKYDSTQNEWVDQLLNKVKYYRSAKETMLKQVAENQTFDCAIITAVPIELDAVLNCGLLWEKYHDDLETDTYYQTVTETRKKLILVCQQQMGMVAAGVLTEKLIQKFHPKLIVMVGITAGRQGNVELGDIIAVSESWDYGSGKIKYEEEKNHYILEPEPHPITILPSFITYLSNDLNALLNDIRSEWNRSNGVKKRQDISIHIGALASGAAVIQTEKVVTDFIQPHNRKVLGVDMETYAVYYAAYHAMYHPGYISLKAVCDFANEKKNDDYQQYAAYVSIHFLLGILDDLLRKI